MTQTERVLWQRLRQHRLGGLHFRRQEVIHGFIVDFYCHEARLAIEVDGAIHQRQLSADQERDTILAAAGIRVVRISNEEVSHQLARTLERIRALCSTAPGP